MRRTFVLTTLFAALAFAQATIAPEPFEAADVHVSTGGSSSESGGFLPNGRLEFRATTLLRLISQAYSVPSDRVVGGPNWLDTARYDVVAKAASSVNQEALKRKLQGLLEERFALKVKRE